jgi:hypothetical protein
MKGSEIAILVLSIVALILAVVRVLPSNVDLYASPSPSPSPSSQSQTVSCQSNGYTSGCVFSAIASGNQYDNPSYCG